VPGAGASETHGIFAVGALYLFLVGRLPRLARFLGEVKAALDVQTRNEVVVGAKKVGLKSIVPAVNVSKY
jgi:hypothetical protein